MTEKITLNFIKGTKMRTFFVPVYMAWLCVIFFISFVGFSFFFAYKYSYFKNESKKVLETQKNLERKIRLVEIQKKRLKYFAEKLDSLSGRFAEMEKLENKIRIIANLDKKGKKTDKSILFGVGGVISDPLVSEPGIKTSNNLVRNMYERADSLENISTHKITSLKDLVSSLEKKRSILAATPSISPAKGWWSSRFGYRKSPFTGKKEFHSGLDIANRIGTDVTSSADGIVSYVGTKGLLGKAVYIDHGHGIITKYGHLSKFHVKKGQKVKRGQKIAEIGNTGRSTGPHLHYSVVLNGRAVNPVKYILD
ncbi:MAG: metalloendopeptidase [Deltaproteobacteria bacterium]|nr:MAG: metalloendopeptidase [Deltaproteobacteria bacterium]